MKTIYLDYAAATPVNERVLAVMQPYFSDKFYNPSALYTGALQAKSALDTARHNVAQLIGAKPSEIIFTAGGTESANLAIHGVMRKYPESRVVVSAIEHHAVLEPAKKYNHTLIPVTSKGIIDTDVLEKNITDDVVLISCMLANNEMGVIQPLKQISLFVEKVRNDRKKRAVTLPLYVHTDACQAPLYLDVSVNQTGVDMMTLNGGKMYGPKQSGILYKKASIVIDPLIAGGGQEWGMRSGTENVAFAVGFSEALTQAVDHHRSRAKEMIALRDYFMNTLESQFDALITGDRIQRLANNVHASFPGVDNERVLFALDSMGIYAGIGSACTASDETSSHVLLAIGKDDAYARSSLRFTLGRTTTVAKIDTVISKLSSALKA